MIRNEKGLYLRIPDSFFFLMPSPVCLGRSGLFIMSFSFLCFLSLRTSEINKKKQINKQNRE